MGADCVGVPHNAFGSVRTRIYSTTGPSCNQCFAEWWGDADIFGAFTVDEQSRIGSRIKNVRSALYSDRLVVRVFWVFHVNHLRKPDSQII